MTGRVVPDGDMPNFGWPGRKDTSQIPDAVLDAVLAGAEPSPDCQRELRSLGDLVTALTAAPTGDELAGQAAALAAFRDRSGVSAPVRQARRRPRLLTPLLSAKAALAAAAVVVSLGGVTAAAYAGALPSSIQRIAHETIDAPAAPGDSPSASPGLPGAATGGLCRAYEAAKPHGSASERSVAFQRLAQAAGGAANIASYCASQRSRDDHPGARPSCEPVSAPPASPPSGVPGHSPSGRPVAPPTCLPSPSGVPVPGVTGTESPSGSPSPHATPTSHGAPTSPSGHVPPSGPGSSPSSGPRPVPSPSHR